MGPPGLDSLPDLFPALLADHAQGQRNRSKASDQDESPSGSFALIIVEPAGKQKADPGAQCDAGSGDEDDLGEGKLPLYHFSNPLSFPALYLAREQVYSWVSIAGDKGALLTFRFALPPVRSNEQVCRRYGAWRHTRIFSG